jgi:hypothetical protein
MAPLQTWAQAVMLVMMLVVYGGGAWVLWMFYRALARIGDELENISVILRDGSPATSHQPPATSN